MPPFCGDKKDILSFISNVDTAFEVVDPNPGNRLSLCQCA
jgi:hypothetical protein